MESNIKTFPLEVVDVDLKSLARMTEGLSGRDLVEKVLKTALHKAITDDRENVTRGDFEASVKKIKKSGETLNPEKMYI
jgi:AAA family ATPase